MTTLHSSIKYILTIMIGIAIGSLVIPVALASYYRPFGGYVITNQTPGIVCSSGVGPVAITPTGFSSPAFPYSTSVTTRDYTGRGILPGRWILGFYDPIQVPLCYIEATPPVPFNAYIITSFGSS